MPVVLGAVMLTCSAGGAGVAIRGAAAGISAAAGFISVAVPGCISVVVPAGISAAGGISGVGASGITDARAGGVSGSRDIEEV
jgi:hypothetical protein